MNRIRRLFGALALCAVLAGSGGCVVAALAVGAAATYGTIKYTENGASRDFHASLDDTWVATIAAMRDNGYPVADSASHGATEGRIDQGDAVVWVQRMPGEYTTVRVKIGTFSSDDHRRRATLILESVAQRIE